MLCITMRKGDYVTLGDSIVIQVEQISNERAHLNINAPGRLLSSGERCWSAAEASVPTA